MTTRAVDARIAELDALSRTRALSDGESRQLQILLTQQRRYSYSKSQQDSKRAAALAVRA